MGSITSVYLLTGLPELLLGCPLFSHPTTLNVVRHGSITMTVKGETTYGAEQFDYEVEAFSALGAIEAVAFRFAISVLSLAVRAVDHATSSEDSRANANGPVK
jgi:uncharacterized Fe-S cluster-containing protein